MKKYSRKKLPFSLDYGPFVSVSLILIVFFYFLVSDSVYHVQLPDGEHPLELYSTEMQGDLSHIISQAIDKAQKSVTLVIYTLTDHKIIKSLNRKSEAGISVKVICDAKTCGEIEKALRPQVKILKRFFKGLMHIKLLIIDDKQTWIGSANMTKASLRHYGNLVAAIESESFAEMASAKVRNFTATERLQTIPHRTFLIGNQNIELWFLPDDPRAIRRIKSLIQGAQKSIRIAMFTWTRRDLAHEVIQAKNRGVKLEVVLDQSSAIGAGKQITNMLFRAGVAPKLNVGNNLLHHKLMVIDDTILVNGSANWTLAAFDKNDDCFIVVYPLLSTQQELVNATWKVLSHNAVDVYK
ncbi:MAG: phospholipase D-like domain-containing protein [Parachlamydiaceae bacterium]